LSRGKAAMLEVKKCPPQAEEVCPERREEALSQTV